MRAPGRKAGSSVSAENHRQNSPISVRARHTRARGARMKVLRWIWFNGDTGISNLLVAYYAGIRRNATFWLHIGDWRRPSACRKSRPGRHECLCRIVLESGHAVGRTPWSAPGPQPPPWPASCPQESLFCEQKSGTRACRADQGVCPTTSAELRSGETMRHQAPVPSPHAGARCGWLLNPSALQWKDDSIGFRFSPYAADCSRRSAETFGELA